MISLALSPVRTGSISLMNFANPSGSSLTSWSPWMSLSASAPEIPLSFRAALTFAMSASDHVVAAVVVPVVPAPASVVPAVVVPASPPPGVVVAALVVPAPPAGVVGELQPQGGATTHAQGLQHVAWHP